MRYLNRLAWAAVVLGVTAGTGAAQQVALPGGGQVGGGQVGGGQVGGGQIGGGQTGGGQTGGGGAGGGGQIQATPLVQMEGAPQITAPSAAGGAGGGILSTTNNFATFYNNPYHQGTWSASMAKSGPGGFGSPLGGTGGGTGAAGARGGAATRTAAGGVGGLGRAGAGGQASANYGVFVPLPVQISYPAILAPQARVAPIAPAQLQADLSGMLSRSTGMIANPAGVQVSATGSTVTLRGTVRDMDEARLIEGMVRLTPGVHAVRNELQFPRQ